MAEMSVYSCGGHGVCRSYAKDGSVNFKYIRSVAGTDIDHCWKENIYWLFLLSGELKMQENSREIFIHPGEICILSQPDAVVKTLDDAELILFTSDHPSEYYSRILQEMPEYNEKVENNSRTLAIKPSLNKFLELVLICLKNGINCKHWFEVKRQEFFMVLRMCYDDHELSSFLSSLPQYRERNLRKYIIDNSLKAKTVQDLADICGYSVGGFKKVFKEIFNEPIYQWMQQQKAEHLKTRLIDKDVSLKVIVSEFGFSSPAHFTKFCKQWLGMTPTQFIKTQQNKLNF